MALEKKTLSRSKNSSNNKSPVPEKEWPLQKRIKVAAQYTLVILSIASIIGYAVYWIALQIGIINPFNLKASLKAQMMNDPKVIRAIHNKLTEKNCTNNFFRISLTYKEPLISTRDEGKDACLQFITKGIDGKDTRTIISRRAAPSNVVLADITPTLTELTTDNFLHPIYEATSIVGVRNNQEYFGIVLKISSNESLLIENTPSDILSQQQVVGLVQSIVLE